MTKSKASKAYRRARRSRLLACSSGKRAFKTKFDADLFLYQEEVTFTCVKSTMSTGGRCRFGLTGVLIARIIM